MADATRPPAELARFAKLRPEVEGVIQHVGRETWDLVLIDVTGLWVRDEFPTAAHAEDVAAQLGVRVHPGWDDPRLVRRMGARDHWASADGQRRAR